MKKGNMIAGFVAGGMLGVTAAVMAVPGYRNVVMKKARTSCKRLIRVARNFMPV